MPFKSEAQRKEMWAEHPAIARCWAHQYGNTPQKHQAAAKRAVKRKKGLTPNNLK